MTRRTLIRAPRTRREGAEAGVAQVLSAAEYLALLNRAERAEARVWELEARSPAATHGDELDAGPS
jgi:hypothetical protein